VLISPPNYAHETLMLDDALTAKRRSLLKAFLITKKAFPREVLLEAIARFVEEALLSTT
jgi:hypothetical protein